MYEEEMKCLMEKTWDMEEKDVIERLIKGLEFYKKLLPKSMKRDILAALQLCNKLKDELDHLRSKNDIVL
jgi:hypothetical protein